MVGTLIRVFAFAMHALESDDVLDGCFGFVCQFRRHHSQPKYDESQEQSEWHLSLFISDKSSDKSREKSSDNNINKTLQEQQQQQQVQQQE